MWVDQGGLAGDGEQGAEVKVRHEFGDGLVKLGAEDGVGFRGMDRPLAAEENRDATGGGGYEEVGEVGVEEAGGRSGELQADVTEGGAAGSFGVIGENFRGAVEVSDEMRGGVGGGVGVETVLVVRVDALVELGDEDVVVFRREIGSEGEVLTGALADVAAEDEHGAAGGVALLPGGGEGPWADGLGVGGERLLGGDGWAETGGEGTGLGEEDRQGDEGEEQSATGDGRLRLGGILRLGGCGGREAVLEPGDGQAGGERGGEKDGDADGVIDLGAIGPDAGKGDAGAVVEHKDTKAEEIEKVAGKHGGCREKGENARRQVANIAENESQIAEGNGAANAGAAGHDKHAKLRSEHHLKLDAGGLEPNQMGKGAGGVGGKELKGEVKEQVEEVGDGVQQEQEAKGCERGAEKAGAAEPEGASGGVGEQGHAGVQDADFFSEEEKQQTFRAEEAGGEDSSEGEGGTPWGSSGLPAEPAPGGKDAEESQGREEDADRAQCV